MLWCVAWKTENVLLLSLRYVSKKNRVTSCKSTPRDPWYFSVSTEIPSAIRCCVGSSSRTDDTVRITRHSLDQTSIQDCFWLAPFNVLSSSLYFTSSFSDSLSRALIRPDMSSDPSRTKWTPEGKDSTVIRLASRGRSWTVNYASRFRGNENFEMVPPENRLP